MKKLIIILTTLFVLTAGNVFGQVNQNVAVSADVLAAISLDATNVSFGNVQQGSVAEVQANNDDGTADSNASAPSAGSLIITADAQDYTVQVTQNALLSDGEATPNTLTFTHRVFLGASNITTAVNGAGHTVTGGGNQTLDIGGQLEEPTVSGAFSTANPGGESLVFSVAYTSF